MRGSLFLLTVLAVSPAVALSQTDAPSAAQESKAPKQHTHTTITGCLGGKPDQYRLKDEKGKTALLYSTKIDLASYVGQSVTVVGDQSATPSTDPGTGRPLPHFKVWEVKPGPGTCK
jgi:hypothetical protein